MLPARRVLLQGATRHEVGMRAGRWLLPTVVLVVVPWAALAVLACGSLKPASDTPDGGGDTDGPTDDPADAPATDAAADADGPLGRPPCPTIASGASVFVIDSTGT